MALDRDEQRELLEAVRQVRALLLEGVHPFHVPGYGEFIEGIQSNARAEREATKLADRLDTCMERRDRLLERAESKLRSSQPVVDLGRAPARWRREADRAIEAGRVQTAAQN